MAWDVTFAVVATSCLNLSVLVQLGLHQAMHLDVNGWEVQGIAVKAPLRTVVVKKEE